MKTLLAAVILFYFVSIPTIAQDFDADSVYYSPIPKVASKKSGKLSWLEDELPKDKSVAYFFNVQTGALIGCGDCSFKQDVSFSVATIHGTTIGKKLRIGAGIGFDTYQYWQTMPVFGSVSWDLFGSKNKSALFLQFNYGWAKPWASRSTLYYYQDVDGGRMVSTQVGYRIKYHDLKISLGIGSKYQRVTASYEYPTFYYDFAGTPRQGTSSVTTLTESINRLAVMMSIGWK